MARKSSRENSGNIPFLANARDEELNGTDCADVKDQDTSELGLQESFSLSTRNGNKNIRSLERCLKFMSSLKKKEMSSVDQQLEEDPELVAYTDDQGISVLTEAVKGGPTLLKAFLTKITETKRLALWIQYALLYAIRAGSYESVEFLVDQREHLVEKEERVSVSLVAAGKRTPQQLEEGVSEWRDRHETQRRNSKEFEDAEFPVYLTPIILAAKLNKVEILKLLLSRPLCEIHPLTGKCHVADPEQCEICGEQKVFKSTQTVEESRRLIEIYQALSSPTYILSSGVTDPVLEAFQLSEKMANLATEDPSFKSEYAVIDQRCRQFACELLDLCRSTNEIETLLCAGESIDTTNTYQQMLEFRRIILANSQKQKEFVAHPFCQQTVQRRWYGGLPKRVCESNNYTLAFLAYLMMWGIFWPAACTLFALKISSRLVTFMKQPINKFISDTISFSWFLILIAYECNHSIEKRSARDIVKPAELLIFIWVSGMIVRQLKVMWRHRSTYRSGAHNIKWNWRWFELALPFCFVISFFLRIIGIIIAYYEDNEDAERYQWDQWHCFLISEGFFSLGTLLSFMKLVGLFKASSSLGPLQISLKLMISDILRFLLLFFLTITGFVLALINIYSNYKGHSRVEEEEILHQPTDLTELQQAYKSLFWALFGYGDASIADVVVGNTNIEKSLSNYSTSDKMQVEYTPEVVKHQLTEGYGYILYALYHVVAIIVFVNMLIAMMAKSFDEITTNSDLEWKFARIKLQMRYFTEVGALPPPFNVTIGLIVLPFRYCRSFIKQRCKRPKGRKEPNNADYEADYEELIGRLAKRYFRRQAKLQTD